MPIPRVPNCFALEIGTHARQQSTTPAARLKAVRRDGSASPSSASGRRRRDFAWQKPPGPRQTASSICDIACHFRPEFPVQCSTVAPIPVAITSEDVVRQARPGFSSPARELIETHAARQAMQPQFSRITGTSCFANRSLSASASKSCKLCPFLAWMRRRLAL